jgi:hypothetical protein
MDMAITSRRVGRLLVFIWLHTENDPTTDEWNAAFDWMDAQRAKETVSTSLDDIRSLVISDGGAPGGVQRARMGRDYPCKASVITTVLSNPIKRGIATALSWINPKFLFCEPTEAERALAHLDLAEQWPVLWPAFVELQSSLPANQTLSSVAKSMGIPLGE